MKVCKSKKKVGANEVMKKSVDAESNQISVGEAGLMAVTGALNKVARTGSKKSRCLICCTSSCSGYSDLHLDTLPVCCHLLCPRKDTMITGSDHHQPLGGGMLT